MHAVIFFNSRLFDPTLEPENPINPIGGSSLLEWFRSRVPADLDMTEPDTEDWGWYSHINWQGRTYLIGAIALQSDDGNHGWVAQIHKPRSFKDHLFGRAKMTPDDPCFMYFKSLIAQEPEFTEVTVKFEN